MSLYNALFGNHPLAALVVGDIGLEVSEFGRFRDAWIEADPVSGARLTVYTRLGGGNRQDYKDIIHSLQAHPRYRGDRDDSFDSTYASFYFAPSQKLAEVLDDNPLPAMVDTDQRWHDRLAQLEEDPR